MKTALQEQVSLSISVSKLYAYARLQQDTDNGDQKFQALAGEAEALAAAFNNAVSFIEPEILSLSQDKFDNLLADPAFSDYRFYLNNLLRLSKHVLPKEQEELLSLSQLATSGPAAIFRSLVSADMQFPLVKNAEGQEVKRVLIDGKNLFGSKTSYALTDLEASDVRSVRVYEDFSPEAKRLGDNTAEKEKVMDVETKSKRGYILGGNLEGTLGASLESFQTVCKYKDF